MALTDYALTTVATLRAELCGESLPNDVATTAKLERLIESQSRRILSLLNRKQIHYEAGRVESVRGFGTNKLRMQVAPLRSIASIVFTADAGVTNETITSTGYTIEDSGLGWILRLGAVWAFTGDYIGALGDPLPGSERPYYKVTYTAGWVTPNQAANDALLTRDLPYDIESACIALCLQRWRQGGEGRSVKSKSLMESSVSYSDADGGLPAEVADMMRAWRWSAW